MEYSDEELLELVLCNADPCMVVNKENLEILKNDLKNRVKQLAFYPMKLEDVFSDIKKKSLSDSNIKVEYVFSKESALSYLNFYTKEYDVGDTKIDIRENSEFVLYPARVTTAGYIIEKTDNKNDRKKIIESTDFCQSQIKDGFNFIVISRMEKCVKANESCELLDFIVLVFIPVDERTLTKLLQFGRLQIEEKLRNKKDRCFPK